jgi:hypothetical protein
VRCKPNNRPTPPAYPVRFKPLLERAPGRLSRKLLTEVAQCENLDSILEDLVNDTIRLVEDLADRHLVPFGNHTTLLREVREQVDSTNQPVKPLLGGLGTIRCDVVYGRLCLSSRGG